MKFKRGDKVRLTEDCPQLHLPDILMPKAGETGRVSKLYRVQDGLEIYQVILDRKQFTFIAAPHTKLEEKKHEESIAEAFLRTTFADSVRQDAKQEEKDEDEEEAESDGLDISLPDVGESPSSGGGDSGGGGASEDF